MKLRLVMHMSALTIVACATANVYAWCEDPVAYFTGPWEVYCGDYATFTCLSYDVDSAISSRSWSGGGTPSTGSGTTFTTKWCTTGWKYVCLTVWDSDCSAGCCPDKYDSYCRGVYVWPVEITSVTSDKNTACVGCTVTFTATTNPAGKYGCLQWTGGGTPATGSGQTFTTSWSTAGTETVTASCCGSSKPKQVTIVEVASLLPEDGTEIDDGDNDPNTKLFVICVEPPSPPSTLTVTAAPNPSVSEANLPSCWTLTGGTGTGKLTRTIDKTTPGETVITCTCNTSMKDTTIWVVRGEVSLASSWACDGQQVNVDLILTPAGVENHITSVQWQATVPSGVTNYGSPSGQGLTFSQRSADITEWRIDNARWYSNQADHCNDDADWEIEATYEIAGSLSCNTNYNPSATVVTFTASAAFGTCLDGAASVTNTFSGTPTYTTVFNKQTQLWETTVAQGTFVRDVQANSWWHVAGGTASQYYDMVKNEEQYHEQQQMENPNHVRWGTAFLVANIMNDVQSNQPYTAPSQAESRALAEQAFANARNDEENRSWTYLNQQAVRCADESEAKNTVGSSHKVAMPCTYPNCP